MKRIPIRVRALESIRRLRDDARAARTVALRPWPAYLAAAVSTGVALGIAAGIPLWDGDARPLVGALFLVAALVTVAALILPRELQVPLGLFLVLMLAIRFALAVVIHAGSMALGREGFVTGDDWNYAELAWGYASWLRGTPYPPYVPPDWNTDVYLFGTYVYLESLVFLLFGRQVLLVEFINSWAMVVTGLVMFDMALRLFGRRPAVVTLVMIAAWPSLLLWSVLNLKDALSLLLIALWSWALLRSQTRLGWSTLTVLLVLLFPLQSLRRYIYLLLLAVLPVGLLLRRGGLKGPPRYVAAVGAVLAVGLFVTDLNSTSWFGRIDLTLFEDVRSGMGTGARTSFQEETLVVEDGQTYVVRMETEPCLEVADRRVVNVERSAQLVVVPQSASLPPAPRGTIYVRVCDIVVVGLDATPAPVAAHRQIMVPAEGRISVRRNPVGDLGPVLRITTLDSLERTIAYLPTGLTYALFAPFPWDLGRAQDLATVPEMLAWYALMPLVAVSVWRSRRQWRELLPIMLYVIGLVLAFSLTEGNYGTLFRHRAMLIPFVILLAAPGLVAIWSWPRPIWRR